MPQKSRKSEKQSKKNKITVAQLKSHLKKQTKAELVEEVASLYKRFDNVKDYYTALLAETDSAVLEKYKEIIKDEFFPAKDQWYPVGNFE